MVWEKQGGEIHAASLPDLEIWGQGWGWVGKVFTSAQESLRARRECAEGSELMLHWEAGCPRGDQVRIQSHLERPDLWAGANSNNG